MSEAPTPPRVVVLGGGSAGWITACLLHKEWAARGGTVTLVESPEIGIIGVGEGSTPQLKALWDHLSIDEADFMAACDATYKLGIRFTGWSGRPRAVQYPQYQVVTCQPRPKSSSGSWACARPQRVAGKRRASVLQRA